LAEREREMPLRKIKKPKLLWVEQAHLDNMETSFQLFEESSWIAPFKLESANRVSVFVKAGNKQYALLASTKEKSALSS
jgi:hypothetical protein